MSAVQHVGMIQRRLDYLVAKREAAGPMAQAEIEALRWALPLLRPAAIKAAKRQHLGEACTACKTPAGFICIHLPVRT